MMMAKKDPRPEKKAIAGELNSKLDNCLFVILTDYMGMDVVKTAELRGQLRPLDAEFHVVKNRMLAQATSGTPFEGVDNELEGPTAMVTGTGDIVAVAKVLKEYVKDNELPVVKIGAMQGVVLSKEDIAQLATMPVFATAGRNRVWKLRVGP